MALWQPPVWGWGGAHGKGGKGISPQGCGLFAAGSPTVITLPLCFSTKCKGPCLPYVSAVCYVAYDDLPNRLVRRTARTAQPALLPHAPLLHAITPDGGCPCPWALLAPGRCCRLPGEQHVIKSMRGKRPPSPPPYHIHTETPRTAAVPPTWEVKLESPKGTFMHRLGGLVMWPASYSRTGLCEGDAFTVVVDLRAHGMLYAWQRERAPCLRVYSDKGERLVVGMRDANATHMRIMRTACKINGLRGRRISMCAGGTHPLAPCMHRTHGV